METNVEIFQRVIEAFNRDGVDGVLPYYTEDAEVYDPDLPAGTYRGRDAVGRVIEMLMSGFEDVEIRDFRLLPAGDRVVALIHTHRKGERDDLEVDTRDAHTITFRDGKITYWRIYLDQVEALQDAGLDPELARPSRA
ncbi:MAG TPA: nuclear transport factor 2 family protein [Solirubrobacterales bacterium]|nr:nuclear transport factor 2 family protein [Solirubrobacterales bacterium]